MLRDRLGQKPPELGMMPTQFVSIAMLANAAAQAPDLPHKFLASHGFQVFVHLEPQAFPNRKRPQPDCDAEAGAVMKPHITVLTLGVDDLDRAVAFYRDGLKLPTPGIIGREFEHGAVAFFELKGNLRLALFPRDSIAHDSGLSRSGRGATEFTLGHNVKTEADVDVVMQEAQAAGAHIVKPAQKTVWGGRAGYFQDPDGHLWEVVFNPDLLPPD
jgi:uncharacterized glyoxalase superfamily protein PhnB